ncbi:hypothetical protein WG926_26695, partial [Tistrella sp. BH-R2-4]
DLLTGIGSGGDAEGDVLAGIEILHGSNASDTLTGGTSDDTLRGFAGDDRLEGGLGTDALDGGAGHDIAVYAGANTGIRID